MKFEGMPVAPLVGLVAASLLLGCDDSVSHPTDLESVIRDRIESDGTAAIDIDGRPVDVSAFEAYWEDHRQMARKQAIDGFIEQELLVVPALDGGFASGAEVAAARKRGMVRRLLEETVEAEVTAESLDADQIDERVDNVASEVGHPMGIRASHILVMVPRDNKKKNKTSKKPELARLERQKAFDDARRVLDEIRETLPESPTAVDLYLAQQAFAETVDEPLRVDMNAHMQFPVVQTKKGSLPEGWLDVVPEFRKPAVDMAKNGAFGQLSDPVRSPFGWHLIVVHEVLDGADPDAEAVREVAVAQLLEQKRSRAVIDLYNKWVEEASVQTSPRVIEEAEELQ